KSATIGSTSKKAVPKQNAPDARNAAHSLRQPSDTMGRPDAYAHALQLMRANRQELAPDDAHCQSVHLPPAALRIAELWDQLPPHIRETIQTLVDAAFQADRAGSPGLQGDLDRASVSTDEAVWRMAQECRSIVQACLREEEWQDADREFFEVISKGI
ncbi:MAG: hypothetical protein AB7E74_08770, partial [Pirellulales bacterium]